MITPEAFTGREKAIQTIRDQLLNTERLSAAIVGGPRTGKTSLLRYLASSYADGHLKGLPFRAYVNAQLLSTASRPADFWKFCCRALCDTAASADPLSSGLKKCLDTGDREIDLWDLTKVFDTFGKQGSPAVLFIDGWDLILKNQNYWGDLFHAIRSLSQRLPRGVAFVVGAPRPLLDLWLDQMGSIYYNTFANVTIGTMDEAEIGDYVRAYFESARLQVKTEDLAAAQNIVLKASDSHPWLVSFLANLIATQFKGGNRIDKQAISGALRDPDGKVAGLMREIRASLTPTERFWLDNPDTATDVQKSLLRRLRDYGLLPPGTRL